MVKSVEELHQEIRGLEDQERDMLLRELIADLDGESEEDVARAWLEEARRRRKELVDGVVEPIAAERVFELARLRLRG